MRPASDVPHSLETIGSTLSQTATDGPFVYATQLEVLIESPDAARIHQGAAGTSIFDKDPTPTRSRETPSPGANKKRGTTPVD